MITKTKIELAQLEMRKWEHIADKYKKSGSELPPFVLDNLKVARKKYNDLSPQQMTLFDKHTTPEAGQEGQP